MSNAGNADATGVTVTDDVPAGSTYVAASATNGGTLVGTKVTWTGLTVPKQSGTTPGTLAVSFKVTVNSTDTNGQVIDSVAVFTNENTAGCTGSTCETNHVKHTVFVAATAPETATTVPNTNTTAKPGGLAFTGADVSRLGLTGGVTIVVGTLLVVINRRRRKG